MAKRVTKNHEKQWQWHVTNRNGDSINRCFCGACGLYSRTWTRLKLAMAGKDALNVPRQSCCNPACTMFALCFPCYGCLVARLQIKVRSFYDIEGDVIPDCCEACCYPGITIVRNEEEIILQEKRRKTQKSYKSHPSMIYVSQPPNPKPSESKPFEPKPFTPKLSESKHSEPQSPEFKATSPKTATPPDTSSEEEANIIVSSDQQECHAPEAVTDNINPIALHSPEDHELVKGIPPEAIHSLEDDPITVTGKFQEHILDHDPECATTVIQVSHPLVADPTITQRAGPSKHELG